MCARNYLRSAVYFETFSAVLGHFPKASCSKHLLVTKLSFLRNEPQLLSFDFSTSQKLKNLRLNNLKTRTTKNAKISYCLLFALKRSYICY